MLYLIRDHDYLKIGYANNISDRMKGYRTHTLYTELLDVKPGTTLDEKALQRQCSKYNVESEWFENCPEVIAIWNSYNSSVIENLDKMLEAVNETDEELSKIHNILFENWPCKATSVTNILNRVHSIDQK